MTNRLIYEDTTEKGDPDALTSRRYDTARSAKLIISIHSKRGKKGQGARGIASLRERSCVPNRLIASNILFFDHRSQKSRRPLHTLH